MFQHLRLKLTVLYAGLFCVILALIGAVVYAVVDNNTQRLARAQLDSAGAMFVQLQHTHLQHLEDGAHIFASSAELQNAVASNDSTLMHEALLNIREQLHSDLVFVVTQGGLLIGESGAGVSSVPPGLQLALARDAAPAGVIRQGDNLFQAAAAPLNAGGANGWIVIGRRIGGDDIAALQATSALPLQASVLTRATDGRWTREPDSINDFIDKSLAGNAPRAIVDAAGSRGIAVVRPLEAIDGTQSVLLLRYPLSMALSLYRGMFRSLIGIGIAGLMLLITGTWLLARGITQPLTALEAAARNLREGVYEPVAIKTKDELARLAESFNTMINAIREREGKITQLAYHDAETRLPNRAALERRLAAAAQPKRLYLAAIGVDRFSHLRGAIGYAHAAALIRRLGVRLARLVPNAPVARLSSDVLGVAFLADDEADALRRADAIARNLEQPLSIDDHVIDVNVAVGVAQPRSKEEPTAAMIERASVALDQARAAHVKAGFFDEAAYGDPARNLSLMGEMRRALESGDMKLVHQPKYDFRAGAIRSAECLVCWKHPLRGNISPDLFVPMAEETGHIRALTEWVLQRTIEDQRRFSAAGHKLALSVNISGRLLGDADFARAAMDLVRGAAHTICFEVTETAVIDDPKRALENIDLFASNGVKIAIDDYGSGLSSLAYLKQMPAHELKIDKLFIQNLTNGNRDALLVRSTVDLAHGLGLEVTAEGVETPAAFAMLATIGCDLAQGYLVSRPATVEELIALLSDEKRLRYYRQTAAAGAQAQPVVVDGGFRTHPKLA
jgi:EAL domain-containing protein (putative c-di-GMP-specific phosphodiesterase class I)/GGDEF domain-containing protein